MRKIGITGSLASGKTSASKILSRNRGPLFSADKEVLKLYKRKAFKRLISKKFNQEGVFDFFYPDHQLVQIFKPTWNLSGHFFYIGMYRFIWV